MAFGMSLMILFIILLINIVFLDRIFLILVKAWMLAFFIVLIPTFFMIKLARFVLTRIIDK